MPSTIALRSLTATLLIAQLCLPAGLTAQQMQPQMQDRSTAPTTPPTPAGAPLTQDERILHVLNRLAYGPRPGDVERVKAMGLKAWMQQQLDPASIDDSKLQARLADFPAMQLPLADMLAKYPTQQMIRQSMNGNNTRPGGEAEKAIYNNQAERFKARKDNKANGEAAMDEPDPLPEDAHAILAEAPAKRFSIMCHLSLPQLRALRQALPQADRDHLLDGFTPQQHEVIAAFNAPRGLIEAEVIQTRLLSDILSERQLQQVMTDFWLNHFNVYVAKSQDAPYYIAAYQRDTIAPRALGHFEDLLVATASSPAMLNYLDNSSSIGPHSTFASRPRLGNRPQQQQASGLNENYARELMELHTVGVNGGYTQKDVTEVAKVFTGWTVGNNRTAVSRMMGQTFSAGRYRTNAVSAEDNAIAHAQFDGDKHEPGKKYVLGTIIKEDGMKEGMEVLHMLANSPQTAKFISTKLAVRFISDNPPQPVIDRMTATFLSTHGDIRQVLASMINSPEFWSREAYRSKVKTPLDYVISAARASGADVDGTSALANAIAELGMPVFGHQTPDGYSMTAEVWNNTASLVARMNFALALSTNRVQGVHPNWDNLLIAPHAAGTVPEFLSPEQKEAILQDKLLHTAVSDRTRNTILTQISTNADQQDNSLRQIAIGKSKQDPLTPVQAKAPTTPAPHDSQAALAAGLIFGSPEFQRR